MDRRRFLRGLGASGLAAGAFVAADVTAASATTSGLSIFDVTSAPFNATGDGSTDDTTAIQAAVDAAGPEGTVYFPRGTYVVSGQITLHNGQQILGDGSGALAPGDPSGGVSVIDFHTVTDSISIFKGPPNNNGARFADLGMLGPSESREVTETNWRQGDYGLCAIDPGYFAGQTLIRNVMVFGGSTAVGLRFANHTRIVYSSFDNQRVHGITVVGCLDVVIFACRMANGGGDDWDDPSNLLIGDPSGGTDIDQTSTGVHVTDCLLDECRGYSAYVEAGDDVTFQGCYFYYANSQFGPRVGPGSTNVKFSNCTVRPFYTNVAANTLVIDEGAQDTTLMNVVTDAAGGGDIDDQGTRTVYGNVNGSGFGQTGPSAKNRVQESTQLGTVNTTRSVALLIARGPGRLKGYRLVSSTDIPADGAKYWAASLKVRSATGGQKTIVGAIDTKLGVGPYQTFGADVDLQLLAGDSVYLSLVRQGGPPLVATGATLFWNPE